MNIKQALKRKNKLVSELTDTIRKVITYNLVENDNESPYSVRVLLRSYESKMLELIEIKKLIHLANQPVQEKIFLLSELKTYAKHLNGLRCTQGKTTEFGDWGDTKLITKTSQLTVTNRDEIISDIERKIELIQDELDEFNHITNI
jgi:hypothetical protein